MKLICQYFQNVKIVIRLAKIQHTGVQPTGVQSTGVQPINVQPTGVLRHSKQSGGLFSLAAGFAASSSVMLSTDLNEH